MGAAALLVLPTIASAQCPSRPTDASGYNGYSYADATAKSFPTSRVLVHYADGGKNAPNLATTRSDGVPDTVAYVGEIAEDSLSRYEGMGYRKLPSDASCGPNGGDGKIDIYLVDFAAGDGTTVPVACSGKACSSFVLVDATFTARGYPNVKEGFRTVVSHELFHAVQNTYDRDLDRFWAEGTAQWAMKTLYPELVDFERQLPAFFNDTKRSLDGASGGVAAGYLYGSAVWPLFLSLTHGPETIREALELEGAGETSSLAAVDAVLTRKGSSLADAFPMFAAWNAATKDYAGTGGYPDAAKYPGVKTATLEDGVSAITSGLSSYAYVGELPGTVQIALETDAARNGGVVVPLEAGKARIDRATKLPATAEGSVLVVVSGTTTKKTDAPFTVRFLPPGTDGPSSSGGGEDSGCHASGRTSHPSRASDAVVLALGLAVVVVLRSRSGKRGRG